MFFFFFLSDSIMEIVNGLEWNEIEWMDGNRRNRYIVSERFEWNKGLTNPTALTKERHV